MLEKLKNLLESHYATPSYTRLLAHDTGINHNTLLRKLRGATPFTIQELLHLAEQLDTGIDEIISHEPETTTYNMELILHDFSLQPDNYKYSLKRITDIYLLAGKSPDAKLYIACNTLPDIIYPDFEWLCRFNHQRWLYFNQRVKMELHSLASDEYIAKIKKNFIDAVHTIKRSMYIINSNIIPNFLNYVRYFYDIQYLNKDDLVNLLNDTKYLLERLESVAMHGYNPENGNEMELFYTDVPLSDEMNLIESEAISIALFYTHINHVVVNRSPEIIKIMKSWFYSWMRNSKAMGLGGSENLEVFLTKQYAAIEAFETEKELN